MTGVCLSETLRFFTPNSGVSRNFASPPKRPSARRLAKELLSSGSLLMTAFSLPGLLISLPRPNACRGKPRLLRPARRPSPVPILPAYFLQPLLCHDLSPRAPQHVLAAAATY